MIRRLFARVLIFALLAFSGYKTWQVQRLQAEVAALRVQKAAHSRTQAAAPPTGWLDRAEAHADRARRMLQQGDFPQAQRELASVRQTLREPQNQTQQAVTDARRRVAALQSQARRLQSEADHLWQRAHPPESSHP